MNKNKSSAYGYYGGVTPANHYVPPPVPDFVPQLPQDQLNIFNQSDRELLQNLVQQTQFYIENAPHILLRTNTMHLSNNVDSFMMRTSADPEDVIIYTSEKDTYDLNIVDAGNF